MSFAFGPKILLDPTFAITFNEIKVKMAGKNRIGKNATLILGESNLFFESLDLQSGSLTCKNGKQQPGPSIVFEKADPQRDVEIYRIRGYKPAFKN